MTPLPSARLPAQALHGPLVNDGYFASGAAWTADESAVVYTAEVCGFVVEERGRGRGRG